MHLFGIFAAEKHAVGRQIFAEVRHPAVEPEVYHILLYHALYPLIRLGIGQIHHGGGEGRYLDEIVVPLRVLDAVALLRGIGVERFLYS